MTDHIWNHIGDRQKVPLVGNKPGTQFVTKYVCVSCGTKIRVRDNELCIEVASRRGIEPDCDAVIIRGVLTV